MPTPKTPLRIVIVGAGLAGLTTANTLAQKGHSVIVLESRPHLSEVGAGIQIWPNAMRVLDAYGLQDKLDEKAERVMVLEIRRYSTGQLLNAVSSEDAVDALLVSRPDFQKVLYSAAIEFGVDVQFDRHIQPSEITSLFENHHADVVLIADGIGSKIRDWMLNGVEVKPLVSNRCFRALIPRDIMIRDPDTASLIDGKNRQCWLGPHRDIIGYPIARGKYYNMVFEHPGEAFLGSWSQPGDIEYVRHRFSDFAPIVQKLMSMMDSCLEWSMARVPELPTWISQDGRILLLGDAAHAPTPHLAQGSAMCMEDAAVIAECLSALPSRDEIFKAAAAFQNIRKDRTERVQQASWDMRAFWTMPDGTEQEARDLKLKEAAAADGQNMSGERKRRHGPATPPWLIDYDAIEEAKAYLKHHSLLS